MAQAGIHGVIGLFVAQKIPPRPLVGLGCVLGNVVPDTDILIAGPVMLFGLSPDDFHRTFTHSVFTIAVIAVVFWLIGRLRSSTGCIDLGLGLSLGMLLHVLVDFLIWFRGMQILWPFLAWRPNLWSRVPPRPEWWDKTELAAEFLCFAVFMVVLMAYARKKDTNGDDRPMLRRWAVVQTVLFIAFMALATLVGSTAFKIVWWCAYIPSLGLMLFLIVHMRETIVSTKPVADAMRSKRTKEFPV